MRGGYRGPRMDTAELDYELPSELIAQRPPERRDESRLLVYDRANREVRHRRFSELPDELRGELVVVNETRVIPARLRLQRPGGGEGEGLLLEPLGPGGPWEGLGGRVGGRGGVAFGGPGGGGGGVAAPRASRTGRDLGGAGAAVAEAESGPAARAGRA